MDSMVRTTMAIKREVNDAKSIRDAGGSDKRKGNQPSSSSSGRKEPEDFCSSRVSKIGLWLLGPRPGLIILRREAL